MDHQKNYWNYWNKGHIAKEIANKSKENKGNKTTTDKHVELWKNYQFRLIQIIFRKYSSSRTTEYKGDNNKPELARMFLDNLQWRVSKEAGSINIKLWEVGRRGTGSTRPCDGTSSTRWGCGLQLDCYRRIRFLSNKTQKLRTYFINEDLIKTI
jgi:hypothetical protein